MARHISERIIGKLRHRRDPVAPRLLLASEAPDSTPRPIFVVGCFRSGTSLIRRILDSHSHIACPPESKFLVPLTSLLRDTPALRGLDAMGYDRATVASALSQVGARFFERYAASRGKARWADKTPDYVDIVENLWELFGPGTRFVLVYRHGMDVAYSLADPRRQYPAIRRHVERAGGDVPVGAANFWVEQTRTMERFRAAHPDACFTLRYEDVTDRPEPALRELFAFLGEPWEPAVLEYQRFEHHRGMEDPDVHRRPGIVRNSGRYRAWPPERQDAVHAVCEPMLAPLGYA